MSRPTIELSMIVRNGGQALARCLASVRPLVDRIIIGDTGSTDDTVAIANGFGAEAISVPWDEDFAAARNAVLAHARCDWILVLDADEMLDPIQAANLLPALVQDETVHAYTFDRHDYLDRMYFEDLTRPTHANRGELPESRSYPGYVRSVHTRLFRRNIEVYFRECVHEQITDRIDHLQLYRTFAPLVIHHFGHVETPVDIRREKALLYHRLIQRKNAGDQVDFEVNLQLGITELLALNQPESAFPSLLRAALMRPKDGRPQLYAGICLLRLGRLEEAKKSLLHAYSVGENSVALHEALGDTFERSGEFSHALIAYNKAYGSVPHSPVLAAKIGVVEVQLGEASRGLERLRAAVRRDSSSVFLRSLLEASERLAATPGEAVA